jgi:Putative bacterial sensory transduction regulator
MADVLDVIAMDDLTVARLTEIYRAAYMNPEVGDNGDIKLQLDGLKVIVKVEPTKKFLRHYLLFGTKPGTTRQQMLELCNRINDGLVMVRASCPAVFPNPMLWIDHDLDTEAGLTGLEVVDETRRFRTIFASVPPLDTDHILS